MEPEPIVYKVQTRVLIPGTPIINFPPVQRCARKTSGSPPPLAGAYVLHPVTMITGYGELGPGGIATTRGCAQGVVRSRVSVVCHS